MDNPTRNVALISQEAQALVRQTIASSGLDLSLPVTDLRDRMRDANTPASNAVLKSTGVTLSERMVGGVSCMIIEPPEPHPERVIVYLFGGGFTVGSAFEDLPISARLAVKTGATVISPDYPLAPERPYPAARDACVSVLSSVLDETPQTCLCGESAGGNLALASLLKLRAENLAVPKAIALLSPVADLSNTGDSGLADRDPFLKPSDLSFYRANYAPKSADLTEPGLSPIYGSFDERCPPVFITTGTRDHLLSGCVRLDRVLRDTGVTSTLRVWEGMWHVFEFYPDIPESDASLTDIAGFLNRHFDETKKDPP